MCAWWYVCLCALYDVCLWGDMSICCAIVRLSWCAVCVCCMVCVISFYVVFSVVYVPFSFFWSAVCCLSVHIYVICVACEPCGVCVSLCILCAGHLLYVWGACCVVCMHYVSVCCVSVLFVCACVQYHGTRGKQSTCYPRTGLEVAGVSMETAHDNTPIPNSPWTETDCV